jgi:hypothetical protein
LRTQRTCIRQFTPGASNLFREWKKILSAPSEVLARSKPRLADVDLVSDAIPLRKWKLKRLRMHLLELGQTLNLVSWGTGCIVFRSRRSSRDDVAKFPQ